MRRASRPASSDERWAEPRARSRGSMLRFEGGQPGCRYPASQEPEERLGAEVVAKISVETLR
jgi:hypothetical protein